MENIELNMVHPEKQLIMSMINWIKTELDTVELPLSYFTPAFIESIRFNVLHASMNSKSTVLPENYRFLSLEILDTLRNRQIDTFPFTHNDDDDDEKVYLFLELETGYFYTNFSKLHLLLTIQIGITQYDVDHKTVEYYDYYNSIERLEKGEY